MNKTEADFLELVNLGAPEFLLYNLHDTKYNVTVSTFTDTTHLTRYDVITVKTRNIFGQLNKKRKAKQK